MKKKIETFLTYIDYELRVVVYSIYEDKPFLLHNEFVKRVKINELTSDFEKEKLTSDLQEKFREIQSFINEDINSINIIYEPVTYYFKSKTFTYDFEEVHKINYFDIEKVYKQSISNETVNPGHVAVDFSFAGFVIDEKEKVINPIGVEVRKLQVYGDAIFSDSKTHYNVINIAEKLNVEIKNITLSNYISKKYNTLENDEILIEIQSEKTHFLMRVDNEVKQFTSGFCLKKLNEELYKTLIKEYDPKESEAAVRFMIEHFVLKTSNIEYNVTENIQLNILISEYQRIFKSYINQLLKELYKQSFKVKKGYIHMKDNDEIELVDILNQGKEVEFEVYSPVNIIEEKNNFKVRYAVDEVIKKYKILYEN